MSATKKHSYRLLLPLWGIMIFACLYVVATFFYPGGSQQDKNASGFSWAQNYWCNLLNENAINGQYNPARPIAISAMFVLFLSLAYFWYVLPDQVSFPKYYKLAIQLSGFIAMAIGMFLFTSLHDIIINIATLCGLVAIVGTFSALNRLKWKSLLWLGLFCMVLVCINNILYYGNGLRIYLPVVQKITFLFFLLWISLIDVRLFIKSKEKQ